MPINPTRSVSTASTPTGIYLGQIVAISNEIGRLDVMVRRLAGDSVFRGVDYVDSGFTTAPKVGEFVAVSFVEGRTEKIIVLGRLRSAVGDPEVDQTGAEEGSILLHDGARWSVGEVIGTVGKVDVTVDDGQIVLTLPPNVSITGDLFVSGNLTVTGTTATVDSVTVTDSIITVGGLSALTSDTNLDKGVAFRWHTGSVARTGFFGYDDSSGKFTFVPDATITGEVVAGTKGTLDAHLEWSDVLNKPDPVVTVTLTGDVTGTASATLTDLASGTVSVATTVAANSVALGTDTTGNYVAGLSAGTGISVATGSGEGVTPTVTNTGVTSLTGTASQITASGSTGAITLSLPSSINVNTTGSAAKWTTARSITLAGDLSGSVSIDGSADATLTATVAANSVALGTDTTGNYVASLVAGTGVTLANNSGEGATPSIAIGQAVATGSSVTFNDLTTTAGVSVGTTLSVGTNLTVTGNLTVNGTTTTVNSTTVTLDDPILTLGGDTAPTVDDNKDRGIEFRYYNTAARIGFFGYDDSSGKFAFLLNATNTSEVFSGTKAEIDATVDWSNIASKPDPVITVTLTGDVTGTANATLTDLASGTVSVATTITGNSVTLGTDTIGDYVATLSAGTGVSVSGSGTEGRAATVAIGQDVATSATPTFGRLTLSQATGTAPMTVSSTTAVTNLNADLLDGQHGSWWVPTGAIMQYAMSTAPAGWLLCDGSPKLKADYPALWALLGNTYGTSNTTEFYLPDLRGRVAVGLDNMGGTDADRLGVTNVLGGFGGVQTVTLADTQIPTHTHSNALGGTTTFATSGHSHYEGNLRAAIGAANSDSKTIAYVAESTSVVASGRGPSSVTNYVVNGASVYNGAFGALAFNHHTRVYGQTDSVVSGGTATVTLTNGGTTGGGGSHDNMQPYLLTCYIIKT